MTSLTSAAAAADRSLTSCASRAEGSIGFVFVAARSSAAYLMSRSSSVLRAVSFEVKSARQVEGRGLAA